MTLFPNMYEVDASDYGAIAGLAWIGPNTFTPHEWTTVARVDKRAGGDGQSVTIQECAMPARFFRLVVDPSPNSIGNAQSGYIINTGSLCRDISTVLAPMARLIADGMIGFYQDATEIGR